MVKFSQEEGEPVHVLPRRGVGNTREPVPHLIECFGRQRLIEFKPAPRGIRHVPVHGGGEITAELLHFVQLSGCRGDRFGKPAVRDGDISGDSVGRPIPHVRGHQHDNQRRYRPPNENPASPAGAGTAQESAVGRKQESAAPSTALRIGGIDQSAFRTSFRDHP